MSEFLERSRAQTDAALAACAETAKIAEQAIAERDRAVALLREFVCTESPLARPDINGCRKNARAFLASLERGRL